MPTNSNPDVTEQIRLGVANSCLKMPKDPGERRDLIQSFFDKHDAAAEKVADAKEEVDVSGAEKRLQAVYGIAKATQKILRTLKPLKPGDRAVVLTQVGLLSKDIGWADKDLVTLAEEAEATAGQAQDDQGSIFDKTATGKAMGGEPRHVEPEAAAPESQQSEGLPFEEYQRRFQEAHDAWKAKGGRGRKPKALVEAEAALTAAEKARTEQEHAAKAETAAAGDDDDFEDDIPEPTSRSPLAGATGTGSYTIG